MDKYSVLEQKYKELQKKYDNLLLEYNNYKNQVDQSFSTAKRLIEQLQAARLNWVDAFQDLEKCKQEAQDLNHALHHATTEITDGIKQRRHKKR